jgi:hypothetical protein
MPHSIHPRRCLLRLLNPRDERNRCDANELKQIQRLHLRKAIHDETDPQGRASVRRSAINLGHLGTDEQIFGLLG